MKIAREKLKTWWERFIANRKLTDDLVEALAGAQRLQTMPFASGVQLSDVGRDRENSEVGSDRNI